MTFEKLLKWRRRRRRRRHAEITQKGVCPPACLSIYVIIMIMLVRPSGLHACGLVGLRRKFLVAARVAYTQRVRACRVKRFVAQLNFSWPSLKQTNYALAARCGS